MTGRISVIWYIGKVGQITKDGFPHSRSLRWKNKTTFGFGVPSNGRLQQGDTHPGEPMLANNLGFVTQTSFFASGFFY